MPPPPIKPQITMTHSTDPHVVAYGLLTTTTGTHYRFEVDKEMARNLITDLSYHLKKQQEREAENASIEAQTQAAHRAD